MHLFLFLAPYHQVMAVQSSVACSGAKDCWSVVILAADEVRPGLGGLCSSHTCLCQSLGVGRQARFNDQTYVVR